jgi:capsid protein
VFVKTEDGDGGGGLSGTPTTNTTVDTTKDEQKLGYGSVVDLNKGESIELASPTRPNGNFDPFVLSFCRWTGVALEIPYEILIKHFTASYSAARAALLEAWKFFKGRREWLAANYCQPEYEWWMEEVVSRGIVAAPGYFEDPFIRQAYLGTVWIGPAKGMIQENVEVEAAVTRIKEGLSNIDDETAQLTGGDFLTNHKQLVKEVNLRKKDGLLVPAVAPADQKQLPAAPDPKRDKPEENT